jgi:hypothetical protein
VEFLIHFTVLLTQLIEEPYIEFIIIVRKHGS